MGVALGCEDGVMLWNEVTNIGSKGGDQLLRDTDIHLCSSTSGLLVDRTSVIAAGQYMASDVWH